MFKLHSIIDKYYKHNVHYRVGRRDIIYLTTDAQRRSVPLVENIKNDIVPNFGLTIVEQEGGRHVTLRFDRDGDMLGEILVYSYTGLGDFRRNTLLLDIECVHQFLCWGNHETKGRLSVESIVCQCFMETFLTGSHRGISATPIPYIQPRPRRSTIPLLKNVTPFVGQWPSENYFFKRKFLIKLGRKIKNQAHRSVVGDWGEIPTCFYQHIRTAGATMDVPLNHNEVRETILSLKEDLIKTLSSEELYQEPLCWKIKKEIERVIISRL